MGETQVQHPEKVIRYFMYHDGTNVVFGRQTIRYQPNVQKNIFGSVMVEVLFPKRKDVRLSFALDEYPETTCLYDDEGYCKGHRNPEENIKPYEEGILMMKQEANRSAMLATRSVADISKEDFDYKNLKIFDDSIVDEEGHGDVDGVVTKEILHLRKGDRVKVLTLDEPDENVFEWVITYDPKEHGKCIKDKFRKFWLHAFNKELYEKRYSGHIATIHCQLDTINVQGQPVEKGTAR